MYYLTLLLLLLLLLLFQMDGSAVIYCPESFLVELGLETKEDLYALRLFCERKEKRAKNKDTEERKLILIEKLRQNKGSRLGGSASNKRKEKSSSLDTPRGRKFDIGWLHYSNDKERFVAVRQSTGGGTRSICMPADSTLPDIMDEARNLFSHKVNRHLEVGVT